MFLANNNFWKKEKDGASVLDLLLVTTYFVSDYGDIAQLVER